MLIKLASGNKTAKNEKVSTWFQYVCTTGQLIAIKEAPGLVRGKRYMGASFGSRDVVADTLSIQEYTAKEAMELMLVSNGAAFGTTPTFANIHLLVDENAESIEVHGVGGYGGFQGRAKIGPLSVVSKAGKAAPLTIEMLAKDFGYVVLAPPLKTSPKGRNLIY